MKSSPADLGSSVPGDAASEEVMLVREGWAGTLEMG